MILFIFAYLLLTHSRFISSTGDHHNFNLDDFSWFTEDDHIIPPEQLHMPNEQSPPKVQHQNQENSKIDEIRQSSRKRRKSSDEILRLEGEVKKANSILEEARKTGKGSLKKPKTEYSNNAPAIRQRRIRSEEDEKRRKERLMKHKIKAKARRDSKTPKEKDEERERQKLRDKKRREWLKLPGNEVELGAKMLKQRASSHRTYIKKRVSKSKPQS